ncbi:hypothetical protein CAPTEDRAFT_202189 [Capitella teleta]|uniref:NACHT domain-containing protein n=1 Tax=Capitella teleta TaxID=283909 RepID=R7TJC4_CAPTE|nr:hypothetical protein CAPTEDRAFT_202189 [Capitella teleta]|eukprot:ELT91651.1 hypothetical protein CAPTEDRAFT_202189 [Capitella teleta]
MAANPVVFLQGVRREVDLCVNILLAGGARDYSITTSELQGAIEAHNVLIIIDAFDEANADNETLDRLIEGDVLRHKTVLITSRFNFLQNKLRHCESAFAVEEYNRREQLEHVKRYAEQKNIDPMQFTFMLK